MKLISKLDKTSILLKGFFEEDKLNLKNLLNKKYLITEYLDKNVAYICLGNTKDYNIETLKEVVTKIVNLNTRDFQIELETFVNSNVKIEDAIKIFVDINEYFNGENLYCAKTTKPTNKNKLQLIVSNNKNILDLADKTLKIAKCVNQARKLQATPPNICNSE